MEQLTLEQAAIKYDTNNFSYPTPGSNVIIPEITARQWNVDAFKAGAEWQKEQYKRVFELLKGIAEWAGNLPDDKLTTATGPNDAALRGGKISDMRAIAVEAIRILEPDYLPFEGYKHS
jgi:hypothetical protein